MKLTDILESPLSMLLVAKRFSGKTFLIKELLNSPEIKKKYKEVYVFTDTGTLDPTWKDVNNKHVWVEPEFTELKLKNLLDSLREDFEKGDKVRVLVIVDDLMEAYTNKRDSVFDYLAAKGRHFLVDYIFTSQKYNKLTTGVRNNSTTKLFFKITNNQESETISKELSQRQLKGCKIEDLIDKYTEEHYNYFVIKDGLDTKYFNGKGLSVKEVFDFDMRKKN